MVNAHIFLPSLRIGPLYGIEIAVEPSLANETRFKADTTTSFGLSFRILSHFTSPYSNSLTAQYAVLNDFIFLIMFFPPVLAYFD